MRIFQPQVIGRQLFVNPVQLTAGIDRRRLFGRHQISEQFCWYG